MPLNKVTGQDASLRRISATIASVVTCSFPNLRRKSFQNCSRAAKRLPWVDATNTSRINEGQEVSAGGNLTRSSGYSRPPSSRLAEQLTTDNNAAADAQISETELAAQLSELPRTQQKRLLALAKLPDNNQKLMSRVRGCILSPTGDRVVCPHCRGRGFVSPDEGFQSCPVCQQWPKAGPLRLVDGYDQAIHTSEGSTTEHVDRKALYESNAELQAWREGNHTKKRRTVKISAEQRAKMNAGRKGRSGKLHQEDAKRRISTEMRRLQESAAHRQRISETLRGKPKVCSLCGQEGHNRRGCSLAKAAQSGGMADTKTAKGRQKKYTYAETVALRNRRREERKNRPKSRFKGLSWDVKSKRWHVQVWTGTTVKSVGYFSEEEAGARAYDRAAIDVRGAAAELNFASGPAQQRVIGKMTLSTAAVPLPMDPDTAIRVAAQSISDAWKAGIRRQKVEFLLPLDVDGESGGMQQEFKAARNLVEATLVELKQQHEFAGRISVQWLDKVDCVAAWQSEKLAAVIFCTADCLPQLRNIDGGDFGDRLTIVFNPQWQIDGQIVSDFGFGRSRRSAESFVRSFQDVFFMQRRRIMGDSVRLFKSFHSHWQVHYIWPNGKGQVLVSSEKNYPTYERLLALLRGVPGSKSSRSWVERVLSPDWKGSTDNCDGSNFKRQPKTGLEGDRGVEGLTVPDSRLTLSQDDLQNTLSGTPTHDHNRSVGFFENEQMAAEPSQPNSEHLQDTSLFASAESAIGNLDDLGRQPDRFAGGKAARDLRLDPVMNLPRWQRQVIRNAFGRDRVDVNDKSAYNLKSEPRPQAGSNEEKVCEEKD